MQDAALLSVTDLSVQFKTPRGLVNAVNAVSFELQAGRTLCIVGESGSGKSVTAMSLMRLLPQATTRLTEGSVLLEGRDLTQLRERDLEAVRGRDIAIIFQDPMSALNPVLTIGRQVTEPLRLHLGMSRAAAYERAVELMGLVGMPSPEQTLARYPHQLSGGQRQRIAIAMALTCNPKVVIADEPTTALDVTTQAQILQLLRDLRTRLGMAVILITHDLGVVAEFADDVLVMYCGRVVERGPVAEIFNAPRHPYTQGLLASIPPFSDEGSERLSAIVGSVPSPFEMPPGCAFAPRCPLAGEDCTQVQPPLRACGPSHVAACLRIPQWEAAHD
ncbi:MAG TPA: ABC transporter ATP-binding protein [Devosiaceae bacterium]|jgi:oligopeptide/dipeptide ABC transporter ATP-binding protein